MSDSELIDREVYADVTPETLRRHAAWSRYVGNEATAWSLEAEANRLEQRNVTAKREGRLVDHLADAYLRGVYADDGDVDLSTFNEASRESVRSGIRAVLDQLSKLDSMDRYALSGFLWDEMPENPDNPYGLKLGDSVVVVPEQPGVDEYRTGHIEGADHRGDVHVRITPRAEGAERYVVTVPFSRLRPTSWPQPLKG